MLTLRIDSTLRWVAAAHTAAVFGQPVLAGLLLSGRYGALQLHGLGADLVFYLGLVQLAAAILTWVRIGVRWPTAAAGLIVLGETGQYTAGLARAVDLHLPLGVALVAASAVLLVALWRPGALDRTDGS